MKRLAFRKTGIKKYKFTLDGEMQLNTISSKTKTETSWILQVKDISDSGYTIDLTAYDVVLKECDNEGFSELFHITRQFQKLYDEIKVKTDLKGNLLEVLNQKQLIEKWKQIKNETVRYFNSDTDLNSFFAISDEEFAGKEFMRRLIRETEFFFIYMQAGGYGQKFSNWGLEGFVRDNIYRTATFEWITKFSGEQETCANSPLGKMKVYAYFDPEKKWLQNAYGKMPFIRIEELKPDFELKGSYLFYNDSGWLKEAELEVHEILHPQLLYHRMKYQIKEIE